MSVVEFDDYSFSVKTVLNDISKRFLKEAGEELASQTIRNTVRKTGKTADSWKSVVDEGQMAVHIGSDYWNAIYEEFGTGEYSIQGSGRKGWWVYVDKGNSAQAPTGKGKHYSNKYRAGMAKALLIAKGIPASSIHITKGKTAKRPFFNAYNATRDKIIRRAESLFGGL